MLAMLDKAPTITLECVVKAADKVGAKLKL